MYGFWSTIPIMIFMGIIALFIVAMILQWLWDITMPDIFGIKEITYWQSFRLFLIAIILFGGSPLKFNHNSNVSLSYEGRMICIVKASQHHNINS